MVRRIRKNGLNSPFATTNKRTPGAPLGTTSSGSSRTPPGQRGCEWTNCVETGEFRTAKSPREMSEHVWLCSEHIREHNKTWNYFEGLNDDEVEAIIKNDTVWQRPTWELGSKSDAEKSRAFADGTRIRDDFGVLNENVDPRVKHNLPRAFPPDSPVAKAFSLLDLVPPVTIDDVKTRYKKLARRHHPDTNNGCKKSEELFKEVGQAYQVVTKFLQD